MRPCITFRTCGHQFLAVICCWDVQHVPATKYPVGARSQSSPVLALRLFRNLARMACWLACCAYYPAKVRYSSPHSSVRTRRRCHDLSLGRLTAEMMEFRRTQFTWISLYCMNMPTAMCRATLVMLTSQRHPLPYTRTITSPISHTRSPVCKFRVRKRSKDVRTSSLTGAMFCTSYWPFTHS